MLIDADTAKERVLTRLADGARVVDAMTSVGRKYETYRDWRKHDPRFKEQSDAIRAHRASIRADGQIDVPEFPEFAETYLHQPLGDPHWRIWDVINGREPRDMHPSMAYVQGRPDRVVVNIPPEFGKSTTWTINYVTWRIHKDPNVRAIIVSKSLPMAKKFLGAIKYRLTSSQYREMHMRWAPDGQWKDPDGSWTTTEIYVAGRGSGEKDPTVQALGLGGQIYGARADLIILDDTVTLANVGQYEGQIDWLSQEVITRLPEDGTGLMFVLGTRVAPIDLYAKLKSDDFKNWDGKPVYTYLSQPAVLQTAPHPKDWVTLWPRIRKADGTIEDKWIGERLASRKASMRDDRMWSLVYQQQDVADFSTFPPAAVAASCNGRRRPGPMSKAAMGHRVDQSALWVVGGLDPATVGHTAALVYGVDRQTHRRYVLDGFNEAGTTPAGMRSMIKDFTTKYTIQKWVVERNAFQRFLTQDEELRMWLASHGCILREHYTTSNKWDEDFGVASIAPLFLSCVDEVINDNGTTYRRRPDGGMIELPSRQFCYPVEQLCEQLVTWQPDAPKAQKTDLVMALWFCEIAARDYIGVVGDTRRTHATSPLLSRFHASQQTVINLNDLEDEILGRKLVDG